MTTFTIHTRTMGTLNFCNAGAAGYVRCDMGNPRADGTLGRQICEGGQFTGPTLCASDENLERVARAWLRAFYRATPPSDRAILRAY